MNGQTKKYNNYLNFIQTMCGPYTKGEIPQIAIDLRGLARYARSKGVNVSELSDSELQPFVLNATIQEMREAAIKA